MVVGFAVQHGEDDRSSQRAGTSCGKTAAAERRVGGSVRWIDSRAYARFACARGQRGNP